MPLECGSYPAKCAVAIAPILEQRYSPASMWAMLGPYTWHTCGVYRYEYLEGALDRVTLILITERSHMHYIQRPRLLILLLTLWLSTALCTTPGLAADMALLSIGPRFGFSGKTPLLGKEQKHFFRMTDVAAVFTLPWSWPLGGNPWSLETRLIASAGLLEAAGDSGLIMTVVPDLALTGWRGLITFDA